ncbi:class I SAM-dependent methyltransferase [Curvivirga aplysinae]|uniref:class I SAM-dependent methyltransferase n=1 Tax=Curvivirga aplysinae TaxID=2529852 RepID=UPI0012BD3F42|nr:class I SAM-dependent methyltransferase [Curvivirga aplysinae]MTI10299.1 class I SAM-dependent methyltransferase [Curvivirga aplysinae]
MLIFNNDIPPFLELVAAGYSMQFNEHGPSPTGVLWADAKGQEKRFATLCKVINKTDADQEITINDLGCGYGALFEYLNVDKFNDGRFKYYGSDICRDMIVNTKTRITDSRAHFNWSYQTQQICDYSFCSGTFNMKGTAEDDIWTSYVKESLRHLFEHSKKGMGFNLHDAKQKKRLEWTYYADKKDIYNFCKKELSGDLTLLEDKAKKEFTILVRK